MKSWARQVKLRDRGRVTSRGDATHLLMAPGDYVLVHREVLRLLVMVCPDGCGETVVVNLDEDAGPAWTVYLRTSGLSIYPSVWRETGCQSHFIIWDDRAILFRADEGAVSDAEVDALLLERVAERLRARTSVSFRDLAIELEEVPWAVLEACDALVKAGRARRGRKRGTYTPSD